MEVDRALLLRLRSLHEYVRRKITAGIFVSVRTGASMHALSCCSSAAQPWVEYPDDAQQPDLQSIAIHDILGMLR